LGEGNNIALLEDLQASPSRPYKNRVKVETLERVEAVAWDRGPQNFDILNQLLVHNLKKKIFQRFWQQWSLILMNLSWEACMRNTAYGLEPLEFLLILS
jgi:hypothetical protein